MPLGRQYALSTDMGLKFLGYELGGAMREYWFDEDDEPSIEEMSNEDLIDSIHYLLIKMANASYSLKDFKRLEEVFTAIERRDLIIWEIEE